MCKLCRGFMKLYLKGFERMKGDEGLPSMMYLATIISILLIFFSLTPENATQYVLTGIYNVILVYLYSFVMHPKNGIYGIVKFVGAIFIQFFVGYVVGRGLDFGLLLTLFVVPIIIACSMIYLQENCTFLDDLFTSKCINFFAAVIISTLFPVILIAIPMFFLDWSILIKIAIITGYILIAPLICLAHSEDYGIFGALGIEW